MNERNGREVTIACRVARKRFRSLLSSAGSAADASRDVPVEHHLVECARCAAEYRVLSLSRAALDVSAAPSAITPDEDFFKAVHARILRGEQTGVLAAGGSEESWAAALLVTARQLIPAMAVLLLLIIGATFLWRNVPPSQGGAEQATSQVPRLFEDPTPTADDALDTFMVAEEKNNGK